MSLPSSQTCASWVRDELATTTWVPLRDRLYGAVRKRLIKLSDENVWEFVEENVSFVAEHLRDDVADCQVDGSVPRYEIDNDPSPYIRLTGLAPSDLLSKIRKIDPFEFEAVCADILNALGGVCRTTQKTNDGGVDFWGVDLKIAPAGLSVPVASRMAVIGQAKRYKD